MIAALGMIGFSLWRDRGRARSSACIVAPSVALSYAAAVVVVNTLRILRR